MANINRNFGKLIDGELTYAPRSLVIDGREIWNPRAETYARAGYLPVDPEFTQTHVYRVGYAIQPSHPLSSPSPPAPNPSQHQSLFQ